MTALLTLLAVLAFAANSLLCRLALRGGSIDAASFTSIRLLSGAIMLLAITATRGRATPRAARTWYPASMLFVYATAFSFAYASLGAGTGALILFGAVQVTMLLAAVRAGEQLGSSQWLGLVTAVIGLVYLALPGLTAPSPMAAVLMATAGMAWGLYSVHGRRAADPVAQTCWNFVLTIPMAAVLAAISLPRLQASRMGILLAIISGAITSGLGYVVWYRALRGLSGVMAALVQLATPVLAALGGIIFLSEAMSTRLAVSAALVLGGIGIAVLSTSGKPSVTSAPSRRPA